MSPSPRRRCRRRLLGAVLVIALLATFFGCSSTITPPTGITDPARVFLLREAMHTGIVLPPREASEEYVEFGFGDWSWFALGNEAWYRVFPTVLWPTQGTLGRRTFGAATPEALRARVTWAELQEVPVARDKAAALRTRLQQLHDSRGKEAVTRPSLGWTFVPYDRSYWFPQNCADVAAEWFRELDCSVGWLPIRMGLTVAH